MLTFFTIIGVALLITFLVLVYLLCVLTVTDKIWPWNKYDHSCARNPMIFFFGTGLVGSMAIVFGTIHLLS